MCLERKGEGERNAVYEAEEGVQRGRGEGSWEPWHSMLAATSHVPKTTPHTPAHLTLSKSGEGRNWRKAGGNVRLGLCSQNSGFVLNSVR